MSDEQWMEYADLRARQAAREARAEAIEEAAQRLEGNPRWVNAAAAIRALSTPPQSEGGEG